MSQFTTRVELHEAHTQQDYETLHKAMETAGFSRTVSGADGILYHMPTAEYNKVGNETAEQIMQFAKNAAQRTGKKFSVFVSKCEERRIYNLKPVNPK